MAVAETVVQQLSKQHDNHILEGALCLLWTLCHTPAIAQRLCLIDHFITELKMMQQSRCSAVSSLAKCVLQKLGCVNHEGIILALITFPIDMAITRYYNFFVLIYHCY